MVGYKRFSDNNPNKNPQNFKIKFSSFTYEHFTCYAEMETSSIKIIFHWKAVNTNVWFIVGRLKGILEDMHHDKKSFNFKPTTITCVCCSYVFSYALSKIWRRKAIAQKNYMHSNHNHNTASKSIKFNNIKNIMLSMPLLQWKQTRSKNSMLLVEGEVEGVFIV